LGTVGLILNPAAGVATGAAVTVTVGVVDAPFGLEDGSGGGGEVVSGVASIGDESGLV